MCSDLALSVPGRPLRRIRLELTPEGPSITGRLWPDEARVIKAHRATVIALLELFPGCRLPAEDAAALRDDARRVPARARQQRSTDGDTGE